MQESTDPTQAAADALVTRFAPMVRSQGGAIKLMGVDGNSIRIGYRPSGESTCDTDACILPNVELQEMMQQILSRRSPDLKVVVSLAAVD